MSAAAVEQVLRVALVLGVCSLAGVVVVAAAPRRWHRALLPGAPALGAALVVVVVHWVGLVVPYRVGAWVVLAGAVLGAGAVLARPAWRPEVDGRAVVLAVLVAASALPAVVVLNAPTRDAEVAGLRFTTGNHDAFYFTAVADWLVEHGTGEVPDVGLDDRSEDGPAVDPVRQYQPFVRWGEAGLQALPAALLGGGTGRHWNALTSAWLLLLPGAAAVLARGVRLGERAAAAAGAAVGLFVAGGGVAAYTVLNQNGPFLLGVGLLVAAAGAVALAVGDEGPDRRAGVVAGVALAGWLGTNYELVVLAVPLLLALTLTLRRMPWPALARQLLGVVVATVVLGLLPVVQAVRGLLFVAAAAAAWPSVFVDDPVGLVVAKLAGVRLLDQVPAAGDGVGVLSWVLALAWVAAAGAALWWRTTRWPLVAVMAVGGALWFLESRGDTDYTANRLAAMTLLVGSTLAVIGAAGPAAQWARRRPAALALGAIAVVAWGALVLSVRSEVTETLAWAVPGREVTADDRQAAGWLAELGGPGGSGTVVLAPDLVRQLRLLDETRGLPDVGWAVLRPDYTGRLGFAGSTRPRLVLVAPGAVVVGDAPVLRANATWELRSLADGAAVVTPPEGMGVNPGPPPLQRWTGPAGVVAAVIGPGCDRLGLVVSSAGPPSQPARIAVGDPPRDPPADLFEERSPGWAVDVGVGQQTLALPTPPDGTVLAGIAGVPAGTVLDLLVGVDGCEPPPG